MDVFNVVCRNYRLPTLVIVDWLIFDWMGAYIPSIEIRNICIWIQYVIGGDDSDVSGNNIEGR